MTNRASTSKLHSFKDLLEIGRGGFGVVYSAKRENGEKVALKKIDGRVSKDRVWNEIKSMRSLKHRNIVEFYEDFVDGGDTYVVMELCELGSLRAYVKDNGPIDEDKAAHVLRQLISAVSYMHRRGVLHRDLSAGNVFIKSIRRGCLVVKLGDFGLATNLRQGETACTIVGTPGYIAPQVFNQDYDQSADVFSLGGVLYTMLTARDPPSKGHISLNGLSSNAARLVEKMMHQDARRRIALTEIAMSDFMRDLEDGGEPGLSREMSAERRIGRSIERRSREGVSGISVERMSRDRRVVRSTSQPVSVRRLSITNRPINDRPPTTSNNENWPIEMARCGGQRVKTAGGRYIVETDNRARFEVAAKAGVIHRILVVEYDSFRKSQKVFVHKIAERRERCREEGEDLIDLTTSPHIYTSLSQLPKDVYSDYIRLFKMIIINIRSRVPKITYRKPTQFPDAVAQFMETGDLRIKFSRYVIVRKVENGEVFKCNDGTSSKKEGVHGATLSKVNEIYDYLRRFEQSLINGMTGLTCFPISFSAGANVNSSSNNSPFSIMPSTASTASRFAFSNLNSAQNQIPRSAPYQVGRLPESSAYSTKARISEQQQQQHHQQNDENALALEPVPKFKLKVNKNNVIFAVQAADGRLLRQSTRDLTEFIFTDPAIRSEEVRFRRHGKMPDRAVELLHYLTPRLK